MSPGTAPVPEGVAVNVRGRSYKILADVEVMEDASGVIFAHGSRFGGHSLFIKNGKLHCIYNFLGIAPEQQFVAEGPLKTQPGMFTLSGDGLRVGYDSGDAVSAAYPTPSAFRGGEIYFVGSTVEEAQCCRICQCRWSVAAWVINYFRCCSLIPGLWVLVLVCQFLYTRAERCAPRSR